jgi:hypothetical protein
MSNTLDNVRRQRRPGETDAQYIKRLKENDRKKARRDLVKGLSTGELLPGPGHPNVRDHTTDNYGTKGHPNVHGKGLPKSPPKSPIRHIRDANLKPKREHSLYGKPINDREAPLRRDISQAQPAFTVIEGGGESTAAVLAQAGGMGPNTHAQQDLHQPPNVPSNVHSNVRNTTGGLGVSPPLGGVTQPTSAEWDNSRDKSANQSADVSERNRTDRHITGVHERGTFDGINPETNGHLNVPDNSRYPSDFLFTKITECVRRSEQAVVLAFQLHRRFDALERLLRQQVAAKEPPPLSSDPAYLASMDAIKAAEHAKDALLLSAVSADGVLPLDLEALDKADENYEAAVESHRANRGKWKTQFAPSKEASPVVDEPTEAALERGYLYMLRRETERPKWAGLPLINDLQRSALKELYLQAIHVNAGHRERGFAMFMLWCEACATDARYQQEEKTPRHLFLSPDLCSSRVALGPESTWWTIERLDREWATQSADPT